MISLNRINLSFGGRSLFKDASFSIGKKEKIGLIGDNGSGKTTLLKIIMGQQSVDSGTIEKPSDITIGYLPQHMKFTDNSTIFEEVKTAFTKILQMQDEINDLNNSLRNHTNFQSAQYLKILNRINDINLKLVFFEADKIPEKIEKVLTGLGFYPQDFTRPTSEFSGGWRMRIELAKIILRKPDFLLLDEPTNHLDIESIQWLETFLSDYPGAVIIISHDITFLDNITKRTVEISNGSLYDYKVPYSEFIKLRHQRIDQQLAAFKNQQKEIAATKEFIDRFRYKATKAAQVQSRIKQLAKTEIIKIDEFATSAISLKFPPVPRSGDIVIEAKGIRKSFKENLVLDGVDLILLRSEKIAFVGKNGEGKTTLLKIIVGNLDYKGKLKIGHNVKIGYFAQNQDELMDEELTVFETVESAASGNIKENLRTLLGAFLFKNEDMDKKVKVLSGGEKSRLALIKLLLEPFNLLVLDEPTNHLDVRSKIILKKALQDFNGSLIVVSHDRQFLDGLVEKIYDFSDHKIAAYTGNIFDFLKKKNIDSLIKLNSYQKINKKYVRQKTGRESYIKKKEFYKEEKRITTAISSIEKSIEELETKLNKLTEQLKSPLEIKASNEEKISVFIKYDDYKKTLDEKIQQWEKLHTELTNLKNTNYD